METKSSVFLYIHFHTHVARVRVTNQVKYSERARKRLAVAIRSVESAQVAPTSATATKEAMQADYVHSVSIWTYLKVLQTQE